MSDYDRTANARYGAGVARSGVGAIDQGLRAYMLGVYNYMTLGLGIFPADDQVEDILSVRFHRSSFPHAGGSPWSASRIRSRAAAHRRWTVLVATPSTSAACVCVRPRYQSKSVTWRSGSGNEFTAS